MPNDLRVVRNSVSDVYQVEVGRDLLASNKDARASVVYIADDAFEVLISVSGGNYPRHQDAVPPRGATLSAWCRRRGWLGHFVPLSWCADPPIFKSDGPVLAHRNVHTRN